MSRFILTKAAASDLDHIWDYAEKTWSADQAEKYTGDIKAACEGLASGQRTGQAVDDIRAGYRKIAVGSHFIFFRARRDGAVEIVRILHQRMDIPSHL